MASTALLIALRTLRMRPWRTGVLLVGFGLGVAVMIALLAVGDALLLQAQDREIVSGGDLVLLPAGIDAEVLKTGAATAMFLAIPNARHLVTQLLLGPRYADEIAAASPESTDKLVYLRVRDRIFAARATGIIPSAAAAAGSATAVNDPAWQDAPADRAWLGPAASGVLDEIDLFHAPPAGPDGETWAEWWYFNFVAGDGLYGYVSFIADRAGRVHVAVVLRYPGGRTVRVEDTRPADELPFARAVIAAGPHRAELRGGVYTLRVVSGGVELDLAMRPAQGFYFPPVEQRVGTFRSGYVAPALRAAVTGTLRDGATSRPIQGTGYHDHNWGVWQAVTWEWGSASAPGYALLAGLVRHPALRAQEMLVSLYATRKERTGLLGVLRGTPPELSEWRPGPRLRGARVRVPGRLRYRAANDAGDRLTVEIAVEDVIATPTGALGQPGGAPDPNERAFLQIKGRYTITGRAGGQTVRVSAPGFAETFVPLRSTP